MIPDYDPHLAAEGDAEAWFNLYTTEIPDDMPEPAFWRVFIMPLQPPEKTKGGILLPTQAQESHSWLNYLGRIAAVGRGAFKHPKFSQLGITEDFVPKVGELVMYSAKVNFRFERYGVKFVCVNDDQIIGRCQNLEGFKVYV